MNKDRVNGLKYALFDHTVQTISRVMTEAVSSGKHEPGSWFHEGDVHHIKHTITHIVGKGPSNISNEDLEHALTRLAMALYCRKKGMVGDFGPDGKGEKSQTS